MQEFSRASKTPVPGWDSLGGGLDLPIGTWEVGSPFLDCLLARSASCRARLSARSALFLGGLSAGVEASQAGADTGAEDQGGVCSPDFKNCNNVCLMGQRQRAKNTAVVCETARINGKTCFKYTYFPCEFFLLLKTKLMHNYPVPVAAPEISFSCRSLQNLCLRVLWEISWRLPGPGKISSCSTSQKQHHTVWKQLKSVELAPDV